MLRNPAGGHARERRSKPAAAARIARPRKNTAVGASIL